MKFVDGRSRTCSFIAGWFLAVDGLGLLMMLGARIDGAVTLGDDSIE